MGGSFGLTLHEIESIVFRHFGVAGKEVQDVNADLRPAAAELASLGFQGLEWAS